MHLHYSVRAEVVEKVAPVSPVAWNIAIQLLQPSAALSAETRKSLVEAVAQVQRVQKQLVLQEVVLYVSDALVG